MFGFIQVDGEVDAFADLLIDAGEDEALDVLSDSEYVCLSSPFLTYSMTEEDRFPFLCLA